jgi:hypothetical protein
MTLRSARRLPLITAALIAATFVAGGALAQSKPQIDPDRLAAATAMMKDAGIAAQFDTVVPLMLQQFKTLLPPQASENKKAVEEVFDLMTKRFSERKDELINQIAVLYASKFTVSELNDVSAFYRSPTGVKFKQVQPQLMQESMAAGQVWGQRIGQEIQTEMQRELRNRGIRL